jgi:hypothetical protein
MDVYVIGYACHPPAEKVLTKRLEEMVYDTSAGIARGRNRTQRTRPHHDRRLR